MPSITLDLMVPGLSEIFVDDEKDGSHFLIQLTNLYILIGILKPN